MHGYTRTRVKLHERGAKNRGSRETARHTAHLLGRLREHARVARSGYAMIRESLSRFFLSFFRQAHQPDSTVAFEFALHTLPGCCSPTISTISDAPSNKRACFQKPARTRRAIAMRARANKPATREYSPETNAQAGEHRRYLSVSLSLFIPFFLTDIKYGAGMELEQRRKSRKSA